MRPANSPRDLDPSPPGPRRRASAAGLKNYCFDGKAALRTMRADEATLRSPAMVSPLGYLRSLSRGRIILWCYAIWYGVNVVTHFDTRPRLWLTSIGLSAIVGTALWISTHSSSAGQEATRLGFWQ